MIKHGKVYPLDGKGVKVSHLAPIREFITKGIADAKEKVVLQPQACDVKGAKRFSGQQCVIAKALQRVMKPQAVAVGRSLAYVVFNGLAVRLAVPPASRRLIEEFDSDGRVRKAPIELRAITKSWKMRTKPRRSGDGTANRPKPRVRKYGVRAAGGGVAV